MLDKAAYSTKLRGWAQKTVKHFKSVCGDDGSLGAGVKDIACYCKAPMMFIACGDRESAAKILTYIQTHFIMPDGDCSVSEDCKSIKGEYAEFWSYINGWIVRGANKLGGTVYPAEAMLKLMSYLESYHVGDGLGFLTHRRLNTNTDGITDVLTAANHGLTYLEAGNLPLAHSAAKYLIAATKNQLDIGSGCFYLRFDANMKPLMEDSPFNRINQNNDGQLYFMLGFPAAFLALLYDYTKDGKYLDGAKCYMSVIEGCNEQAVVNSMWSHKVAWAAAILYRITGCETYINLSAGIMQYMGSEQDESTGLWYRPVTGATEVEVATAYDQSAEIACWMLSIAAQLNAAAAGGGGGV